MKRFCLKVLVNLVLVLAGSIGIIAILDVPTENWWKSSVAATLGIITGLAFDFCCRGIDAAMKEEESE